MNRQIIRGLLFAVLGEIASSQQRAAGPPEFFQLLRTHVGVSEHDLAVTLPAGRALATLLPVHKKEEVAVAGIERVRVSLQSFLDAFGELPTFNSGREVLQIHEFSSPPREQDLQSLALGKGDIQALRGCSPGDCGVKMSAPMMEQFRGNTASTAVKQRLFRRMILQYLTQYLKQGNPAMVIYADKLPAIHSSDEFQSLLKEIDWLNAEAPPLYDCLKSFSGNACPQVRSFLYWSNAKFGLKPVFTVTQVMIYRTVRAGRPWVFIAFKQVYADHYFDASLGLAVLAEQSAGPTNPALWVLYLNRSRADALGGWLGPLKRSITERRSRGAMQNSLLELKERLERKSSHR